MKSGWPALVLVTLTVIGSSRPANGTPWHGGTYSVNQLFRPSLHSAMNWFAISLTLAGLRPCEEIPEGLKIAVSAGVAARTATVTGMVSAPVELSIEIFAKPVSIACGSWTCWVLACWACRACWASAWVRYWSRCMVAENTGPCCWNWCVVSTTSAVPSSRAMAGPLGAIDGAAPASARPPW